MPSPYQKHLISQVANASAMRALELHPPLPGDFVHLLSLSGGARALVVARLQQVTNRPVLVITADAEAAEGWYDDLQQVGPSGLHFFPMTETLPYEIDEPVIDLLAKQYGAMHYLRRGEDAAITAAPKAREDAQPAASALLIAPLEALQHKIPTPVAFDNLVLTLNWGETFDTEKIALRLVELGYERQAMAETRGEFSVRGNIVDIFPPHFENPVRFDLFGDEVESIRFFDPTTQRSLRGGPELERITILPAKLISIVKYLAQNSDNALCSLADWMPKNTLVVLDQPEKFDEALERFDLIAQRRYEERDAAETPKPVVFYADKTTLHQALNKFGQVLLPQISAGVHLQKNEFDFGVQSYETIKPDLEAYLTLFSAKQKQDYSIHLICDNDGQALRMEELLRSRDLNCRVILSEIKKDQVKKSNAITADEFSPRDLLQGYQDIVICSGPMQTGFIFPDARLLMVTDREMFGRYKRRHAVRRKYKGRAIAAVTDIQRGDYVVHIDHGVGRYIGIREQNIDGRLTELIELEYSEGAKLLVPVENVGHIQKYSSTEGAAPALDNLGGTQWKKRRKKSQEKVEQMAKELLEIYAKREAAVGEAFSPDNTWQVEFEDSFLYQETPDQLRAIEEIKADMCSNKPMDRLLCGDVGFGKTEVAMRAVFKCVMDKKQAAVLVPTTILAQQHYHTFRERFADYPVRVGVLSRFCTDAEQHETIRALKKGEVDVVIGTHRLLSTDVEYLDLGLLVVDEEHRFGVAQKEKVKRLRASIDILTLSATPIPRTLHFALGGLRDMSVINTPPRDRLPVRTRVIHFVPNDIEEAIMREINRGGQIYFVHNRVETIARVAQQIKQVVPKARICIAHGQMHERELEKVMVDFIDRKFDILIATTIIENGLDIPNVNTIIINRADAFGLAQLYQLRGRVGRDVKRAYAYLVVPDGRPVTDTALRRLRAIEEFTELGMGFQIALRDMEIRGVGNLLGSEQHGAIDTVGFEMYCQMLEEAVQLMRGGGQVTDETVEIQWKISALFPAEYVPVESQRLNFYKRCAAARTGKELEDMRAELRDRYGELPQATLNLLSVSLMRVLARRADVSKVSATGKGFTITPRGDVFDFLRRALPLREKSKKIKAISATADGSVAFEMEAWNAEKGIEFAMKVLKILGNETQKDRQ